MCNIDDGQGVPQGSIINEDDEIYIDPSLRIKVGCRMV